MGLHRRNWRNDVRLCHHGKESVAVMLGVMFLLPVSCLISGAVGAVVPLILKNLGPIRDGVSIVVTFHHVGCLAVFLGLAAIRLKKIDNSFR
jgi:hypothetical protein